MKTEIVFSDWMNKQAQGGFAEAGASLVGTGIETLGEIIPLMFLVSAVGGSLAGYVAQRATSPGPDSQGNMQKELLSWKQQDALARSQEEFSQQKRLRERELAAPKRGMMWR